METNSQLKVLEGQLRDCFARVVWTHKTLEKCADIMFAKHNAIKLWQVILSGVTTTSLLINVFGKLQWVTIISALLSASLFAINLFVKGHDFGEIAKKHADAASDLWLVREKYLSLLVDLKMGTLDLDEVRTQRDVLQGQLSNCYKGSPRTRNKAYQRASKALKVNEELTLSDEEIDRFLPAELKRGTLGQSSNES